jgi:hypothetical protein
VAKWYRAQKQPVIAQSVPYTPTRSAQKPPFYEEIEAASRWPRDSERWQGFVSDIVRLPATMILAVQEAIGQHRWKIAPNPLASVRTAAHQEAKRMGLV